MTTLPEPARVLETAELIADADAVTEAIERMAADINAVFADKSPVVFGVMIGGVVPLVRLMRRFRFPHTVNYLHATRYRGATTGGDLVWRVAPPADLHGRDVLIIDDILDEGITLRAIVDEINDRNPGTVHTAVLVRKRLKPATTVPLVADFVGLEVPVRSVGVVAALIVPQHHRGAGVEQLATDRDLITAARCRAADRGRVRATGEAQSGRGYQGVRGCSHGVAMPHYSADRRRFQSVFR